MIAFLPFLFSLALLGPQSLDIVRIPADSGLVEREAFLMGTRLRATVVAQDAQQGFVAIEAAFREVERLEALLSSWREDSELSRLNTAEVGKPFYPSRELFDLLLEVRAWSERSEGAFDVAVGSLIDAWDLQGSGRRPTESEVTAALMLTAPDVFRLDERDGSVVRARSGSWITSGGFGKGAALRAAALELSKAGIDDALLDFGGQVLAIGSPPTGAGWAIGVAHPAHRDEQVVGLRVRSRSVATSAASERFVEIAGERFGHVLDPRTGHPVQAWGSVTVVAEDPLVADVVATALFVIGPKHGAAWAESLEDTGVLFLRERSGEVDASWNSAMDQWLITGKD